MSTDYEMTPQEWNYLQKLKAADKRERAFKTHPAAGTTRTERKQLKQKRKLDRQRRKENRK